MLLRSLTRGRRAESVADAGATYARSLPERFRPDVLGRLRWHHEQGHDVVLVSASLCVYLDHLRDELDLADVMACELAADDRGILTGELARPNVRGPEKESGSGRGWPKRRPYDTLWAYGNSSGDRELLAMADRALLVGQDPIPVVPAGVD